MAVINALAVVESSLMAMDSAVAEYNAGIAESKTHIRRALVTAIATRKIEQALTDQVMVEVIVPLADKDYGFLTDNNSRVKRGAPPYAPQELKAAVMSAVLKGAQLVNNEFNVISGRCYLPKNYFVRKVREFSGLTDLKISIGVPSFTSANSIGGKVPCSATWKLNGQQQSIDCTGDFSIPVKGKPEDVDAMLGKAERKILARVYSQLTGSAHDESEPEDFDGVTLDGTATASPPAAPAVPQKQGAIAQAKELLRGSSATVPAPQQPEQPRAKAAEASPAPAPATTAAQTKTAPPPAPAPAPLPPPAAQPAAAAPAKRGRKPAQAQAPEAQAQPAAAAEAQAEQAPDQVRRSLAVEPQEQEAVPSAEEGEQQTCVIILPASVKGLGKLNPATNSVDVIDRFRVTDDKAQQYYTKDRAVAKMIRAAASKQQSVSLVVVEQENQATGEVEDIILSAELVPQEANEPMAAQTEG